MRRVFHLNCRSEALRWRFSFLTAGPGEPELRRGNAAVPVVGGDLLKWEIRIAVANLLLRPVNELRHDINTQEHTLTKRNLSSLDERVIKKQEKLRNEMEYLERDFTQLKNEFYKYLSSVL